MKENPRPEGNVGFIGLGDMGGALAMRMLEQGVNLTVFDVNVESLDRFRAAGASAATSPADLASRAEIVFACLPSPAVSEDVALGNAGVIHGTAVRVYVELSTIGYAVICHIAQELQLRNVGMLDAPVSGGPIGVRTGQLTCLVSGRSEHLAIADVPLRAMADRLFHIGQRVGQSQVLKLANNLLMAANLTMASEVLHMASTAGIDPEMAIAVLNASSGRNRATELTFPQQVLSGDFSIGAKTSILHKDVQLALAEARRLGTRHALGNAVLDVWSAAIEAGYGPRDFTEIHLHLAQA